MPTPSPIRSPQDTAHQRVGVIACGKHPGWPEQIDNAGRATALLGSAKRSVYVTGIATASQRGVWDRVPAEQRLDGFSHELLWLAPDASGSAMAPGAVGRMWSSRDSRGRTGWPMLVLAGVEGAGTGWLVDQALSRLGAVERMCRETSSPELVRLSLGEAARQVEDALAPLIGAPKPEESDEVLLRQLVETGGREKGADMIARVGEAITRGDQHLRVPRMLSGAGRAMRAWAACVRELLPDQRAVLVLDRDGAGWIDIVLGNADPLILSCLRANETHTPLTTSGAEPTLDSMRAARARAEGWCAAAKEPALMAATPDGSPRRGVQVLTAGALALLAVVAWLLIARLRDRERGTLPEGPLVKQSTGEPATRQAQEPIDPARVVEDVSRAEDGFALLRAELRDQGGALDETLESRVRRVSERVRAGERSAELAREAESVRREIDALRSEAAGRVLEAVREALKQPPQVSEPLRKEYKESLMRIAPREGMAKARARIDQVTREARELDRLIDEAASRTISPGAGVNTVALRDTEQSRVREAREQAARALEGGERAIAEDAAKKLRTWREDVMKGVRSANAASDMLDAGATLPDAAREDDASTLLKEAETMRALPRDVLECGAFEPVLRRIESLERVRRENDTDALLEIAERARGDGRISEEREAWRRLRELEAPRSREQLRRAARALKKGDIADQRLRADAEGAGRAMWLGFVDRDARDSEDARAALETRADMHAPDEKTWPSWLRAAGAVAALTSVESDSELRAEMERFVAASGAWRDVETREPSLARLRELCERALATQNTPGVLEGPASAGWTVVEPEGAGREDSANTVTMRSPEGSELTFRKTVAPASLAGDEQREVYVSTTEFSVRDLIELTRARPHLVALLPDHGYGPADSRAGVRTWTLRAGRVELPAMNSANGWQRVNLNAPAGPIAPGLTVPTLSAQAPVQSISPVAASAIARELGCRLPTVSEWAGACEASPTRDPNLRDATFALQARFVRDRGAATGVAPPSTDAFRAGVARSSEDTDPATDVDDGLLWFADVEASKDQIAHLVGNVAEYVIEDREPLRELVMEPGAIEDALRRAKISVLGASALSHRMIDPHTPYEVDPARASMGYSDVGFRLVFERMPAPKASAMLREVREIAKKQPIPTPPPRAGQEPR